METGEGRTKPLIPCLITITKKQPLKHQNIGIGGSPGITYFLHKNLAVESYFGYLGFYSLKSATYENGLKTGESRASNINSYLNLSLTNLYLGVNFYFGGKAPEVVKEP